MPKKHEGKPILVTLFRKIYRKAETFHELGYCKLLCQETLNEYIIAIKRVAGLNGDKDARKCVLFFRFSAKSPQKNFENVCDQWDTKRLI